MDSFVILGSSPQDSLIESQIIENTNLSSKSINQETQIQSENHISLNSLNCKTPVDESKNNALKIIDAAITDQLNMITSSAMAKSNQMESFNMSLACELDRITLSTEKNDVQQQEDKNSIKTDVQLTNPEVNSLKCEKNSLNVNKVSSIAENIIMGTLDPRSLTAKNLSFLSKPSLEQKQCFEGMLLNSCIILFFYI